MEPVCARHPPLLLVVHVPLELDSPVGGPRARFASVVESGSPSPAAALRTSPAQRPSPPGQSSVADAFDQLEAPATVGATFAPAPGDPPGAVGVVAGGCCPSRPPCWSRPLRSSPSPRPSPPEVTVALSVERAVTSGAIVDASGVADEPEFVTAWQVPVVPSQDPEPCEPRAAGDTSGSVPSAELRTRPVQGASPEQVSAAPAAEAADAPVAAPLPAAFSASGPDSACAAPGPVDATEVVCGAHSPPPPVHDARPFVVLGAPVAGSWLVAVLVAVPEQPVPAAQSTRAEDVETADGPDAACFCPGSVCSGPEEADEAVVAWQPPPDTSQVPPPEVVFGLPPSTAASAPVALLRTSPEQDADPSGQSVVPDACDTLASPPDPTGAVDAARVSRGSLNPVEESELVEQPPPVAWHPEEPVEVLASAGAALVARGPAATSPAPVLDVRDDPVPVHPAVPAEQSTVADALLVVSAFGAPGRAVSPVPWSPYWPSVACRPGPPSAPYRPSAESWSSADSVDGASASDGPPSSVGQAPAPRDPAGAAGRGRRLSDELFAVQSPAVAEHPDVPVVVRVTGTAPADPDTRDPAARVSTEPDPVHPERPAQSTVASDWPRPNCSPDELSSPNQPATVDASRRPRAVVTAPERAWQPPPDTEHRAAPEPSRSPDPLAGEAVDAPPGLASDGAAARAGPGRAVLL